MTMQKTNETMARKEKMESRNWGLLVISVPFALLLIGSVIWMYPLTNTTAAEITVYKSSTCGCCNKWIDHLRGAGFNVKTINHDNMGNIKSLLGVRPNFQSCHTATVEGYVVEGHVPANDIKRLLQERPDVTGITVPGMPIGSPGMEVAGHKGHSYHVLTFDKNGRTEIFAKH